MSSAQIDAVKEVYELFASVALDDSIDKLLEYGVPSRMLSKIEIGMRVTITIKGKNREGTVMDLSPKSSYHKVQPLVEILSSQLLSKELLLLAKWICQYYCSSLRRVLKFFIPSPIRDRLGAKEQYFVNSLLSLDALAKIYIELREKKTAQAKVIEILLQNKEKGLLLSELLEKTGGSKSPIDSLVKQSILSCNKVILDRTFCDQEYFLSKPKTLSTDQSLALAKITSSLDENHFKTHLIHGVTGSGKTEVYMQAIAHARSQGNGALMLVPEIALTTQMIERFRSRFQEKIGIYHYRLSDGERYDLWNQIQQGTIQIVLGARSAIFLPIKDLKLIIVDEEHETSYKQQEETPCYHGRDVAIMRGSLCKAAVVLGSATPSLESYYNALKGKYTLSSLTSRAGEALFPKVKLINMQREKEKHKVTPLFSSELLDGIAKRIKQGEQVLLFLNRRGYHSVLLCSECDHVEKCPHCDVALTYHLHDKALSCHYCDFRLSPPPKTCKSCHSSSPLIYRGCGTEQVETQLKKIFPVIRTLRMDADTTKHKGSHEKLFKEFRSGKADVLIGTQMIAKGFHFPSVTLVGVLNADQSLHSPDFRASEHLFQLLVQVSGRSGRGSISGEVLIQTSLPDHKLFSYLGKEDYEGFYQEEITSRELFGYPPFSHLAKVVFSGPCPLQTEEIAKLYHQALIKELPSVYHILAVIPDKVSKIKGYYRYYFLTKGPSMGLFSKKVKELFEKKPLKKDFKVLIDIDN